MYSSFAWRIVCILVFLLAFWGADRPLMAGSDLVLRIKGSDTMAGLIGNFVRVYKRTHSDLKIEASGGGTSNGISAFLNSHVEIATSSRKLKESEIRLSQVEGMGYQEYVIGWDTLTFFVHPANPITTLDLNQIRAMYARNSSVLTWNALGVTVPNCPEQKIKLISRKNNSGSYEFLRTILYGYDSLLAQNMTFVDGSQHMVQTVANNPCALGYAGMVFIAQNIKPLCIRVDDKPLNCEFPGPKQSSKNYPFLRPLSLYTTKNPPEHVKTFIDWVLGDEGQKIVEQSGFITQSLLAQ